MKFNVVIGNPPYNNDIYINFVMNGYSLSTEYTNMITPSKWAYKVDDTNIRFRDNIMEYIKTIVYYPESYELFNIAEPTGITYYLITKNKCVTKTVINKCEKQKLFNNKAEVENIIHLNNIFRPILNKVINDKYFSKMEINTSRAYWITQEQSNNTHSNELDTDVKVFGSDSNGKKLLYGYFPINEIYSHIEDIDKYKLIMHFKTGMSYCTLSADGKVWGIKDFNLYEPYEICKDDYMCCFKSYDINELYSIWSYFKTKFIRALAYCGCCGSNASNIETWRFIPIPKAFDHIFTDNELYKQYNLTQEEINIIETIIKERK